MPPSLRTMKLPKDAARLVRGRLPDLSRLPRIRSFTPSTGVCGQNLTLGGENFRTTRGRATIQLGTLNVVCTVVTWEPRRIVITIPADFAALVGDAPKDTRVWVYAEHGNATTVVPVGPDVSQVRPVIQGVSDTAIRPGQEVLIEGTGFLGDRRGSVEFVCRAIGRSFLGNVRHFADVCVRLLLATGADTCVVVGAEHSEPWRRDPSYDATTWRAVTPAALHSVLDEWGQRWLDAGRP